MCKTYGKRDKVDNLRTEGRTNKWSRSREDGTNGDGDGDDDDNDDDGKEEERDKKKKERKPRCNAIMLLFVRLSTRCNYNYVLGAIVKLIRGEALRHECKTSRLAFFFVFCQVSLVHVDMGFFSSSSSTSSHSIPPPLSREGENLCVRY